VAQSPIWGLGRVYALEHPETWGGLLDLDPDASPEDCARRIIEEVEAEGEEDQIAYRGAHRMVARIRPSPITPAKDSPVGGEGAYLITGGLGGLGLKVARWLADRGARNVVLIGRTPLAPGDTSDPRWSAISDIEQRGASVRTVAADVTNKAEMERLVAELRSQGTPLRGVFHAAAVIHAAPIAEMDASAVSAMLAPKVAGTLVLHEVTKDLHLDMFVLFSSTTALLGVGGMAHYAAANQFMDTFAHHRHGLGLPALSVNWGTWDVMRAASAEDRRTFLRGGLRPMKSELALEGLGRLLDQNATNHVIADVDWKRLKAVYEARRHRSLLEDVGQPDVTQTPAKAPAAAGDGDVTERIRALPVVQRSDALVAQVSDAVITVLRLGSGKTPDRREGFFDMGMDSLMAVELKSRLEAMFGQPLPSTLTFNYPNIEAVSGYLETELFTDSDGADETAAVPTAAAVETTTPATAVESGLTEAALAEMLADRLRGLGHE
jgi:myxalamid-type polyketide synthase MxaE and MxaD